MNSYRRALEDIMMVGEDRGDRTGTGTKSLFGLQMKFPNVGVDFPLLTGKSTHWRSIAAELTWFCKGLTNVSYLHEHGCTIWDEWADEQGNVGPVYGAQWRGWGHDQLATLMHGLEHDPYGRRHIVSAWNVEDLEDMKLPPCHLLWQCYVRGDYLDLMLTQRSADMFLGMPFNIASYAALMFMISYPLGMEPGTLTINVGDAHIYDNHLTQTRKLLHREWPSELPQLRLKNIYKDLGKYEVADFDLIGYNPLPKINAPISV